MVPAPPRLTPNGLSRRGSSSATWTWIRSTSATGILFESNGGMTRDEATLPEIRYAVGDPDLDVANVETALDGLTSACYYLQASERNRYRFTRVPTLNKMLIDRRASVQSPVI